MWYAPPQVQSGIPTAKSRRHLILQLGVRLHKIHGFPLLLLYGAVRR